MGADIDGEAVGDQSGYSVSMSADGNRLAVGAPFNDGTGINVGQVRVYDWVGSEWKQLGDDIDGEGSGNLFGNSVSLSSNGSCLAVGAVHNNGNGIEAGHVRVYNWNGSLWTQLGADIDAESEGDISGWSVSLSSDGSRLAVGAPYNSGTGIKAGHVRVFNWNGSVWTQLGTDIDAESEGDLSGWSISLSSDGSSLAIGAPYNSGTGNYAGHVRVYRWEASTWIQLGTDIDGEAANALSGWSVSLSSDGSRLAVGAIGNSGTGIATGHVRVYRWENSAWIQLGTDIDGETAGDYSGYSVSLSSNGSRLAVGAIGNNGTGSYAGHVRVFSLLLGNTVINIDQTNIEVSPNPTTGVIKLNNVEADRVQLLDNIGRLVFSQEQPGSVIDISNLPVGIYFMKIYAGDAVYSARVIKE